MEDGVRSVVEAQTVLTEYLHTQTLVVALMSLQTILTLASGHLVTTALTPVLPLLARESVDPVTTDCPAPGRPPPMSSLFRQQMDVCRSAWVVTVILQSYKPRTTYVSLS